MGAFIEPNNASPTGFVPLHPFFIPIVMVDHDPVPENTLISASHAYKIVTPTKFGVEQFERKGQRDKTYYIPFAFPTNVFKPTTDRKPCIEELSRKTQPFNNNNFLPWNPDDIFLISSNGANKDPYRKAWPRMFLALQIFLQQNPDAANVTRFYAHTWMRMSRDIPHIAKTLGVEQFCKGPADYHMWQGVPTPKMAMNYQASDVYLHLSQGGGFEIPIMEAMCCGIPVIVNDFVGMRELTEDHGWLIPPIRHFEKGVNPKDPEEEVVVAKSQYFTPLDATVQIADEWEAAMALEKAYNNPDQAKRYGEAGRIFSLDFDSSIVNGMWYRLFEEIREERSYKPLESRKL
jgi:glycosyltransferase involved in cell wall biosynthesis